MRVTYDRLEELEACEPQLARFSELFGKAVDVTEALCIKHVLEFDWDWARRLLPIEARLEYCRVTAPARQEFYRALALASRKYDYGTASARGEYDRATEPARREYRLACAAAFGRLAERVDREPSVG
jgi:hypothetical protein